MSFEEELRKLRELRGLSQKELAAKLDVSFQAVQHWEAGRKKPRPKRLRALEEILHLTEGQLFRLIPFDKGNKNAENLPTKELAENPEIPQNEKKSTNGIDIEATTPQRGGLKTDESSIDVRNLRELNLSLDRDRRIELTREEKVVMKEILGLAERILQSRNDMAREALRSNIIMIAMGLDRELESREMTYEIINLKKENVEIKSRIKVLEKGTLQHRIKEREPLNPESDH